MAFLGIALFAEGPTDHRFLSPLIPRLVVSLLAEHGASGVDIGEVISLSSPDGGLGEPREARIAAAALAARYGFHVLCVHADGGGAPDRARAQQVTPGLVAALRALAPEPYAGVAVVPVREMEAWALVDGDALRRAFRTTLSDRALGLPRRPREAEGLRDPKRVLDDAYAATLQGTRRRVEAGAAGSLELIAENVRIDRLQQVPAFAAFRAEMEAALRALHFIR